MQKKGGIHPWATLVIRMPLSFSMKERSSIISGEETDVVISMRKNIIIKGGDEKIHREEETFIAYHFYTKYKEDEGDSSSSKKEELPDWTPTLGRGGSIRLYSTTTGQEEGENFYLVVEAHPDNIARAYQTFLDTLLLTKMEKVQPTSLAPLLKRMVELNVHRVAYEFLVALQLKELGPYTTTTRLNRETNIHIINEKALGKNFECRVYLGDGEEEKKSNNPFTKGQVKIHIAINN